MTHIWFDANVLEQTDIIGWYLNATLASLLRNNNHSLKAKIQVGYKFIMYILF